MEADKIIELTQETKKGITLIMKKYILEINSVNHWIKIPSILDNMMDELQDKYTIASSVDGEKILVKEMVRSLIKYDNNFKNYNINEDKTQWILREFHDSQFDYDGFKEGVKQAMLYTEKYYEE